MIGSADGWPLAGKGNSGKTNMSEESFIREVDEELRSDQVRKFWDRYKWLVIGVAVSSRAQTLA